MKLTSIAAALVAAALVAGPAFAQEKDAKRGKVVKQSGPADMTFFVTSKGKGNGADLGGLEGPDAHCNALAKEAGSKHTNWKAYLSAAPGPGATGAPGVNARDRIGKGPWRNAKGTVVATSVANLHSEKA